MRATQLHTICIMTLAAILFSGVAASAQDSNMEATAGCVEDVSCMFRGLDQNDGLARLQRINIFSSNGRDPRVAQNRAAEAARALLPIVQVENNNDISVAGQSGKGKATAFLISPCYALTNRHVVYGDNLNPDPNADWSMTMNIGSTETGAFRWQVKATPVLAGNLRSNPSDDWAVIELEKCAGKKVGWMDLGPSVPDMAIDYEMAGFPGDRPSADISLQSECKLKRQDPVTGMYYHDCASRPGASGSPIFRMINGRPTVIGIHSSAASNVAGILSSYSEAHANKAVPLDFLDQHPEIRRLIELDVQSFGQPNPAVTAPAQQSTGAGQQA